MSADTGPIAHASSVTPRQVAPVRVALVSARAALALDEDLPPLIEAFTARGVLVETPCWDDQAVDWARYHVAVLRSTWDYAERVDEFLRWADRCAAQTHLLNPPAVLRFTTDKHYLLELARAGVPVVTTRFVEPGADARSELSRFLAGNAGEFVVKPAIGAGSRDAARYVPGEIERARAHVERLTAAGRSVMLQPYLEHVDEHGETAVIYIDGLFSHAVRKGALLRAGGELVTGLFAPEEINVREPDDNERHVAAAACAALPFERLLYARIDLIRDRSGEPVVLELELAEPSLFFNHAPGSAERFAAALLERMGVSEQAAGLARSGRSHANGDQ